MCFRTFSTGRKSQNVEQKPSTNVKAIPKLILPNIDHFIQFVVVSVDSEVLIFIGFFFSDKFCQNLPGILGGRGCSTAITRRRFFGSLALACVCE